MGIFPLSIQEMGKILFFAVGRGRQAACQDRETTKIDSGEGGALGRLVAPRRFPFGRQLEARQAVRLPKKGLHI